MPRRERVAGNMPQGTGGQSTSRPSSSNVSKRQARRWVGVLLDFHAGFVWMVASVLSRRSSVSIFTSTEISRYRREPTANRSLAKVYLSCSLIHSCSWIHTPNLTPSGVPFSGNAGRFDPRRTGLANLPFAISRRE